MVRAEAMKDIVEHTAKSNLPHIGGAYKTVLMTTEEPERIWTSNWSQTQIHQFSDLLQIRGALPASQSGISALEKELLHLAGILARTAIQLWIIKASIESPLLRRRRIEKAIAREELKALATSSATESINAAIEDSASDTASTPSAPINHSPAPAPYLCAPTIIGNHSSTTRERREVVSRVSPAEGILSFPSLDSTEQADLIRSIRNMTRAMRVPFHLFPYPYYVDKDSILAVGRNGFMESSPMHVLCELTLSQDPSVN